MSDLQTGASSLWLPILVYHRVVAHTPPSDPYRLCVSAASFERQLQWLDARGYTSVSLDQIDAALDGAASLPPKPVAITFDDGYLDNHVHAWPLLRRHGFAATFFIVADAIGRDNRFDEGSDATRLPMMEARHLAQMQRSGMAFGSHTCTHPRHLDRLCDAELEDELTRSREAIAHAVGAPVRHFAYPYFRHDARLEAAVARCGYRTACAGFAAGFTRYALQRIIPLDHAGPLLELRIRRRQVREAWRRWNARAFHGEAGS